jgi:Mn-dependent DtxR family transcriptional regulator
MKLKLQLVRDGEVLFEVPLFPTDWPRDRLKVELENFEEDFQRFNRIFDALSHETRFRMMKLLMEEEDQTTNFAAFMRDLDLNPKIVWENAKKLREGGLLEKIDRGKYRCSEVGQTSFIMMSFAFRRLTQALEEMKKF